MKFLKSLPLALAGILMLFLCSNGPALADPIRIVVIGDSNIAGKGVWPSDAYPAQLEQALRAKGVNVSVTNAGKSGDTTGGVLARLDSSVPAGTDVAIVSVGVSDVVLGGSPPEAARANVAEIARRLKARNMEVIVLPTGKKFQGAIAEDPKYHVVEGAGSTATGPAKGTTNWHLTREGYAIVANTLPQVMAAVARAQKAKQHKA